MASFADEFFTAERGLYETLVGLCAERGLSHEVTKNYIFFAKLNGHCLFWLRRYKNGVCFCARRTLSPYGGENILRRPFSEDNADQILSSALEILEKAQRAGLYSADALPALEECAEDACDADGGYSTPDREPTHFLDDADADALRAVVGLLAEHIRLHGDFPLELHGKRMKYAAYLLARENIDTANDLLAYGVENLISVRGMGRKTLRQLSSYLSGCTDASLPPKSARKSTGGAQRGARSETEERVLAVLDAGYRAETSAERRTRLSFASARFFALLSELAEQLRLFFERADSRNQKARRNILLFLDYAQSGKTLAEMASEQGLSRARVGQCVMRGRKSALVRISRDYNAKTEPFYTKLSEIFALLADAEYDILRLFEYGAIARSRREQIELSYLIFGVGTVQRIEQEIRSRQKKQF